MSDDGATWTELDLPCKPGAIDRRPCFAAPYHYRLDWNIWFIGFKPHAGMLRGRESWLFTFVAKILAADGGAISLLDATAAEALRARRPTYAKVEMWHYMMAAPLSDILYAEVRRDPPEIRPRLRSNSHSRDDGRDRIREKEQNIGCTGSPTWRLRVPVMRSCSDLSSIGAPAARRRWSSDSVVEARVRGDAHTAGTARRRR